MAQAPVANADKKDQPSIPAVTPTPNAPPSEATHGAAAAPAPAAASASSGHGAGHGTSADGHGGKEKAHSEKSEALARGLKGAGASLKTGALDILRGFVSPDRRTRRMAWLFLVSCLGILFTLRLGWKHLMHKFETNEKPYEYGADFREYMAHKRKLRELRPVTAYVGVFTLELKRPKQVTPPGILNVAEIEIVVECDDEETSKKIEGSLDIVRDKITSLLVAKDRDELLSLGGKQDLKNEIKKQLNQWLHGEKIHNVFFIRMIIN